MMPTVRLAPAETGVSHRADLRLRPLFRPRTQQAWGIEPLAWIAGSSAHESKVACFCIGANTPEALHQATRTAGSWSQYNYGIDVQYWAILE